MSEQPFHQFLHHTLEKDFENPNPEIRKSAIFALGRLGTGPWVLDLLRRVAASDADPEVRYAAKKALNYWEGVLTDSGQMPDPPSIRTPEGNLNIDGFLKGLNSVKASDQIHSIIEAVRIGDTNALPHLNDLTETEGDPWVLSMAVKAVGSLAGPEEIPRLSKFLDHENHRVIANAIEALEILADPDIQSKVVRFLDSPDNRVRANAVMAISLENPDLSFQTLEKMSRDHRPWMRASAIFCLKLWNEDRAQNILLEICEKEFQEELLGQALDALVANAFLGAVGPLTAWAEGSIEHRAKMLERARDVIASKVDCPPDDFSLLKEEYVKKKGNLGSQSGMFRLDKLDLEEAPIAPSAPSNQGYGKISQSPVVQQEDQMTWKILAASLGLALLAAIGLLYFR